MENSYLIGEKLLKEVALLETKPKLLLHACCAPCSTYPLDKLKDLFDVTLFYNNSNIYPFNEYDRRLKELYSFIKAFNEEYNVDIKIIVPEYKNDEFNKRLEYAKDEPEKGKRCKFCYAYRLQEGYKYAFENNFDYFSTVMTISGQKDEKALNKIGRVLENIYPSVKFIEHNFKKQNGQLRSLELSKKYNLYRQTYCGCKFSIENQNKILKTKQG